MSIRGSLVLFDPAKVVDSLTVREGETVERQVFVNTAFTLNAGSRIRYCTLGNCGETPEDKQLGGDAYIEHCIITAETDIGALWDMAATCDIAGHLARDDA